VASFVPTSLVSVGGVVFVEAFIAPATLASLATTVLAKAVAMAIAAFLATSIDLGAGLLPTSRWVSGFEVTSVSRAITRAHSGTSAVLASPTTDIRGAFLSAVAAAFFDESTGRGTFRLLAFPSDLEPLADEVYSSFSVCLAAWTVLVAPATLLALFSVRP
jgi:hypothetical protein